MKASSWDYKTQTVLSKKVANSYIGPGNLSSKTLSKVVGLSDFELQSTIPQTTSSLTDWANAELVKSAFAKIQGDVTFRGTSLAEPGKFLTFLNFSKMP